MRKGMLKKLILSLGVFLSAGLCMSKPVMAMESSDTLSGQTQKVRVVVMDGDTENKLNGAKFTLAVKMDGTYVDAADRTGITVSNAGFELGELSIGEYRLTQTQAPNCYGIIDEVVEFQVTAEGVVITNGAEVQKASITAAEDGTYTLAVSNMIQFIVRLPSTGGVGTLPYTIGGALLMAGAVMYGLILRHRGARKV